jgi:hypothetical protein
MIDHTISKIGIYSKALSTWFSFQNLVREMALVQDNITIMASQDVTEEQAEKFEVECGFCSKLIAIRSLEAHIMVFHAKEYSS